jgi:hypothetical protein
MYLRRWLSWWICQHSMGYREKSIPMRKNQGNMQSLLKALISRSSPVLATQPCVWITCVWITYIITRFTLIVSWG